MKSIIRTALLCTLFAMSSSVLAKDAAKAPAKGDKKAEKAAKPINKICPVEGGDIDPEVTVKHEGKTVAFCCAGCDETFKKDPAKYLAIIAAEPKNTEKGDKDAKKDGKTKKEGDAKEEGDAKHEGDEHADDDKAHPADGEAEEAKLNAKCPVSGDDADKAQLVEYKGKTVAFCCADCAKDFEKNPKKYLASLEAQEKAAAKKDDHDHDADGKADHAEEDHDHEAEDDKAKKADK